MESQEAPTGELRELGLIVYELLKAGVEDGKALSGEQIKPGMFIGYITEPLKDIISVSILKVKKAAKSPVQSSNLYYAVFKPTDFCDKYVEFGINLKSKTYETCGRVIEVADMVLINPDKLVVIETTEETMRKANNLAYSLRCKKDREIEEGYGSKLRGLISKLLIKE